jgi:membrane protein
VSSRQSVGTKGARLAPQVRGWAELWAGLFRDHDLLTYASAIARTMLVATVSVILLLLGIAGAIGRRDLWTAHLGPQVRLRVLPDVYAGINQTVERIFSANSPGLIVFAIVLAVWEVSGSVRGVSGALNRIYETQETRSWKARYPVSFALALVVDLALVSAILLAMAAGGAVHGGAAVPFAILRWLAAVFLVALAFGVLVRFAPAKRRAKKWASIGAGIVVAGWLVESLAFKWYIDSLANFRTAVGSLTVVLVVISYMYLASIILLVGIEADEMLRQNGEEAERTIVWLAGLLTQGLRRPRAVGNRPNRA